MSVTVLQEISAHWAEAAMAFCMSALIAKALSRRLNKPGDLPLVASASITKPRTATNKHRSSILKNKLSIMALVLILVSLPVIPVGEGNHLSLAAVLAGVLGELSSLSVLLVLASLFSGWLPLRERKFLLLPIASGLLLYWTVLTYGPVDVYRLGYLHAATGKLGTIFLLAGLAISSLMLPLRLVGLLTVVCLSWALGLQASTNLWDYLLDLPAFFVYLGLFARTFRRRVAL
jgi:hypothetical protein